MTAILGISAFYHDSAAALIVDGQIAAAAQQERFSRLKHDEGFPRDAIEYCLSEAGVEQIDYVAYYEKPLLRFERLLESYLAFAPAGYRSFRRAMSVWLKQKLHIGREIRNAVGTRCRTRPVFVRHHQSHAASAFYPSPFEEAAIVTCDGVGEWTTTAIGKAQGTRISLDCELRFPHSLGLLYSAFTYFLGFQVNDGEYKVMGLAPYGRPIYRELILERLIDLREDGSFHMDMRYFNYCQGLTMTGRKFHELLGGPPRRPDAEITEREMDLAASLQSVTEEILMRIARRVHHQTRMENLVMAGGVALNCVANGRILREGPFQQVWVQPAAGDAGGALGAAMFVWHQLLEKPRQAAAGDSQRGSFLGPEFTDEQITDALKTFGAGGEACASDDQLCTRVADLLVAGKTVGWFQGRMEFGPRALGARSIFADGCDPQMQSRLNRQIKMRESFRPFAPMVLRSRAAEFYDVTSNCDSPYMLFVAPLRKEERIESPEDQALKGFDKLRARRSDVPAATHVDYTARLQTVDAVRNPLVHQLLEKFERRTGIPILLNTSFNVAGEPIVCTPEDAYHCFMSSGLDALAIGRTLLVKQGQPELIQFQRKRASERNSQVSVREIRQFAFATLIALPLIGWWSSGQWAWVAAFAAISLVVVLISWLVPAWLRPLYRALMLLTFPIGACVGEIAHLAVFLAVFTPVGLAFRIMRRDALRLRTNATVNSYWQPVSEPTDYYRQS